MLPPGFKQDDSPLSTVFVSDYSVEHGFFFSFFFSYQAVEWCHVVIFIKKLCTDSNLRLPQCKYKYNPIPSVSGQEVAAQVVKNRM